VIPDLVDTIFGDGSEEPSADEYYPGSRRKKAEKPSSNVEFIPDPWRENFTTKVINGVETKMYPIGALANALGVSVQSIRHWTRSGYIPAAPYRLPANMVIKGEKVSGRRLYTEPLIEAVVAAFEKRGLLGKPRIEWSKHSDLPIEIKETWSRIVNQTTTRRSN
jgi:hypothetical protein